jgi:hypothetical protein
MSALPSALQAGHRQLNHKRALRNIRFTARRRRRGQTLYHTAHLAPLRQVVSTKNWQTVEIPVPSLDISVNSEHRPPATVVAPPANAPRYRAFLSYAHAPT